MQTTRPTRLTEMTHDQLVTTIVARFNVLGSARCSICKSYVGNAGATRPIPGPIVCKACVMNFALAGGPPLRLNRAIEDARDWAVEQNAARREAAQR